MSRLPCPCPASCRNGPLTLSTKDPAHPRVVTSFLTANRRRLLSRVLCSAAIQLAPPLATSATAGRFAAPRSRQKYRRQLMGDPAVHGYGKGGRYTYNHNQPMGWQAGELRDFGLRLAYC
jgi:hypothetical protein